MTLLAFIFVYIVGLKKLCSRIYLLSELFLYSTFLCHLLQNSFQDVIGCVLQGVIRRIKTFLERS